MANGLSGENLDIQAIFAQHENLATAARLYFSPSNPDYEVHFFGVSADTVEKIYLNCLDEISKNYSLSVLAAVEAAFRVDYILRFKLKKRTLYRARSENYIVGKNYGRPWRMIYSEYGSSILLCRRRSSETWLELLIFGTGLHTEDTGRRSSARPMIFSRSILCRCNY